MTERWARYPQGSEQHDKGQRHSHDIKHHQNSSKFIKDHQTVSSKFIKPYEFSIEILCYGRQAFEIGGACPSLTTPQLGVWCFPESLNRKMSQLPPGGRHIFLPCRFLVYRIVEPQEAGEQWFELDWNKSFAARADKVATLYLCRSQWHHMISWKCRKLQKVPIGKCLLQDTEFFAAWWVLNGDKFRTLLNKDPNRTKQNIHQAGQQRLTRLTNTVLILSFLSCIIKIIKAHHQTTLRSHSCRFLC